MENETKIPLFRRFVIQNFPYIEQDFDALTDYQLISKIVEYLNQVITSQNNLVDDMNDLETAFNTLKDYVDHYFDNLDVQEEINNKLDEMTEDGSLTAIIKAYVDPIYQAYEEQIDGQISSQNTEISNFKTQVNLDIANIDAKVDGAVSGSPLVASSTDDMTETDRVYVNTTDGKWYYYDGEEWQIGGTYQATSDSATIAEIQTELAQIRTKQESVQLFDYNSVVKNKNLVNTYAVATPYDMTDATGVDVSNLILFDEPLTEDTVFSTNIETFSRILTYQGDGLVREGNYSNSSVSADAEYGNKKITINASVSVPIRAIRFSYLASANTDIKHRYFCKRSEYTADLDTTYKNYYELNDKLDVSHLIANNPINYNGNEVNTFYKGIAIGDSLTEGTFNVDGGGYEVHKQYAYPMYFYKKTGTTLRNFGVGGATAQSWYERYENVTFPVYDFAIIALGVNDIINSVSNETTITYIGNIVTKLKSRNADVKVFISTLNKAYKNTTGWASLNTAIKTYVASTDGCYLLDIAQYGLTDVDTDYVDGHLTALGYRELANEYANMISSIMHAESQDFTAIQFSGTEAGSLPTD